jgi:hypothetical protein
MEKEDISDLVPQVDERLRAKNAGRFNDSIRYYDNEMQRLKSAMPYEERQRIPEYESMYVQERRSERHMPLEDTGKDANRYNVIILVSAAAAVFAIAAFGITWPLGLNSWEARGAVGGFVLALVTLSLIISLLWNRLHKEKALDYSKMPGEERLKMYAEYSFQGTALKKMLEGETLRKK